MSEVERVEPEIVRNKVEDGDALLVCAYEDDAMFENAPLEGAIPLSEFQKREEDLPSDQELFFY